MAIEKVTARPVFDHPHKGGSERTPLAVIKVPCGETRIAAPARVLLARQATYAGPIEGCAEWLQRWIDAGARHIVFRFAGGDQLAQVDETAARLLPRLRSAFR